MPLVEYSSYHAPFLLNNRHLQTILPTFLDVKASLPYQREEMPTPDNDSIFLDWLRCGSDKLMILSHGLCGNTHRHYALKMVKAFHDAGWDCLAWNYRGTGESGHTIFFTTMDSSRELAWVTEYAIRQGHYKHIAYTGFSMGGNLSLLYLTREAKSLPPQVCGAALFSATIDLPETVKVFQTALNGFYQKYFLASLKQTVVQKHALFPSQVSLAPLPSIRTMRDFDNTYTAPICGFSNADQYWEQASACRYLDSLQVPVLLVNPANDPILAGNCFPVTFAQSSPLLFLERPASGGHCGFLTHGSPNWWPAQRALEFLTPLATK